MDSWSEGGGEFCTEPFPHGYVQSQLGPSGTFCTEILLWGNLEPLRQSCGTSHGPFKIWCQHTDPTGHAHTTCCSTVLHIPQGTRYCSQVSMVPKAWHNTSALGLHGAESTHTSPLPQPCGHPICVYPVAGMEPAGMAASRAAVGCPTQLEESEWLGLEGTLKFIQFQPSYRG